MDDMIRQIGLMLMAGIALCAGPLPTAAAADATRYGYTAKYMGVPEGLSSQRAYKVCCDADGAMWIATLDGIDRWNGRTMKHYGLERHEVLGRLGPDDLAGVRCAATAACL